MNYHTKKMLAFFSEAVKVGIFTQRQYDIIKKVFESVERNEFMICDMIETHIIKSMSEKNDFCISDMTFEERFDKVKKRKEIAKNKTLENLSIK